MNTTARQRVGWGAANVIVLLIAVIPVLWLVSLSLKDPSTLTDGSFYPHKWTFENYRGIFDQPLFTHALVNSIGIALISTLLGVVLGAMAAYADRQARLPGQARAHRLRPSDRDLPPDLAREPDVQPMADTRHLRHMARAGHPVHHVLAAACDLHALGVFPRDPVGARASGRAGRGHAHAGLPAGDPPARRPRRVHDRDPCVPLSAGTTSSSRSRSRRPTTPARCRPPSRSSPGTRSSSSRPGRSPPRPSSSPSRHHRRHAVPAPDRRRA